MGFDFNQLMKADRRKQWKLLKDKHSKAISKSKVNFDQKLGPALDKYQSQVEKLTALAGKAELTSVQVDPVLKTTTPLKTIVATYTGNVKVLEEPARKELGALLAAIQNDIASWEELAFNTMGSIAQGTTDAQKAAAKSVQTNLDNIRAMCLMIVTRGPRAIDDYKKSNRPLAVKLTGLFVESARLAGSASHELANAAGQVIKGSNYELFKARAKAAEPLLQKCLDNATVFKTKFNISLDDTICSAHIDAAALESAHGQLSSDFNAALTILRKLP